MQNKQTKLLVESWRAFLKEEEKPQEQGANKAFQTLDQLVDKAYPEFVQGLQSLIKNQEFASLLKAGNPQDSENKINVQETTIACTKLKPMQNVIGLDDSLQFDLKQPKKLDLKASGQTLGPEVYDYMSRPIITCGEFIVDGHHRWSTCYMLNPNNSLKVQNITNFKDGTSALKASQLIIAAIKGNVPISKPKGINVYASDPVSIKGWIEKTMTDAFVKEYSPFAKKIMKTSVDAAKQVGKDQIQEAETAPSSTQQQKQDNKLASKMATGKIDPKTGKPVEKKPGTPAAEQSSEKTNCVNALMANITLLRRNNAPTGDASKNPRTIMPQFADEGPAKELKNAMAGDGVNVKAIKQAIGVQESLQNKIKLIIKEEIKKIKK